MNLRIADVGTVYALMTTGEEDSSSFAGATNHMLFSQAIQPDL